MPASPPCAAIKRANRSSARPDESACSTRAVAAAASCSMPARTTMRAAMRVTTAVTSGGPLPLRTSRHSMISSELPTAAPSGASMSVTMASVRTPDNVPISTIARPSACACATSFMNAPSPHLTSRTSALLPSASFLLMIDAAISGIDSTVAVTSRSA
jgi:hypothetical protein